MAIVGDGTSEINMVPRDFVVDAIHFLATQSDTVGEVRAVERLYW
jgi:hypothetical protein